MILALSLPLSIEIAAKRGGPYCTGGLKDFRVHIQGDVDMAFQLFGKIQFIVRITSLFIVGDTKRAFEQVTEALRFIEKTNPTSLIFVDREQKNTPANIKAKKLFHVPYLFDSEKVWFKRLYSNCMGFQCR